MRGKALLREIRRCVVGITPAYAGKRRQGHGQKKKCGDHPRICGEKKPYQWLIAPHLGSPPHMRGKDFFHPVIGDIAGITPAYAGKRGKVAARGNLDGDHPRICGEKVQLQALKHRGLGSPPHMRGKAVLCIPHHR